MSMLWRHVLRILSCRSALLTAIAIAMVLATGCSTEEKWIQRRPDTAPFSSALAWLGEEPETFSPTILQVASTEGLDPQVANDRQQLLSLLQNDPAARQPEQLEFALSELTAYEGDRLAKKDTNQAVGYYAQSLIHGYRALSGAPHRRTAGTTQQYNQSLESLLRLLRSRNLVCPGTRIQLPASHGVCSIAVEFHSKRWTQADFQNFEFANDYQVLGLRNHYYTSGVGVPLIATRLHPDRDHAEDKHYPQKLCYPLTAFVRVEETTVSLPNEGSVPGLTRLVLELHDPMEHSDVEIANNRMPLESDLTTPLAFYLDQPELSEQSVSTLGLLNPGSAKQLQGLYLLEPFDPNRIPVVMVHGLWSSPATWMEMFNDLRSDPRIRSRYQFWFYLYPTGSPFWVSAADFRNDLKAVRQTFDPEKKNHALDQMVVVGHSMGGLLSRLQAVDSGQDFWKIVSDRQFKELDADPEVKRYLSDLFFFQPNTSIRRVVTIGTPHRGSRFVNGFTKWVGGKLISLPMQTLARRQQLFRRNPNFFRPQIASRVMTSIDSLSPTSPILAQLLAAPSAPWINYHNVVGDQPHGGLNAWLSNRGDGVVSLASARLDDLPGLASQIVVPQDHVTLHRHPQSIEEVRRVLLTQLQELDPNSCESIVLPNAPPMPPSIRLVSGIEE